MQTNALQTAIVRAATEGAFRNVINVVEADRLVGVAREDGQIDQDERRMLARLMIDGFSYEGRTIVTGPAAKARLSAAIGVSAGRAAAERVGDAVIDIFDGNSSSER